MVPKIQSKAGLLRALAAWGSTSLPKWWLKSTPGLIGLGVGAAQQKMRARVRQNLRIIYGPRPHWLETQDLFNTFSNYGYCLAEAFAASADRLPELRFEHEHSSLLKQAQGQSFIIATAHIGSWELSSYEMVRQGFRLAIAMAPEHDADARAVSDTARHRAGVQVFHVGHDPFSALPLLQHLRNRGILAFQLDRTTTHMRTHKTQLFGLDWNVPLGPFQIAQKLQLPIVPVFTARLGFAHHLIKMGPWLEIPRHASSHMIHTTIQQSVLLMQEFIRKYPTQWFHFNSA